MNNPVSPLWSVQQHAWLRALGHTVWLYGSALTHWPLPKPIQSNLTAQQQPSVLADTETERPVSTPLQPAENLPQTPTALPLVPDRLTLALMRASGANPNEPYIHRLMENWPLDELRTSPAAKRAFWPQLRALRRQQRQSLS